MPLSPDNATQEALRYCRWLTRRAGSNFSLSFALLPADRRVGMEVLYAYCRAVDDVADRGDLAEPHARAQLALWRQELAATENGFPAHPIGVALRFVRARFDLPRTYFEKILAGVEMDLKPRRYETFEQLQNYCEHVASAVGLASVRIFGCRTPAADRYAQALGIAFQMTNILRDVKPDAAQGRVYLPQEDLRRFGCSPENPSAELMAFETERAQQFFRQAEEHCRESGESRKLLPARIMSAVYQEVLRSRARVPKVRQVGLALQCLLTS